MKKILNSIGVIIICLLLSTFIGGVYVGARYTDNKIGVDSLQRVIDSLKLERVK